jgi:hypothetical protein
MVVLVINQMSLFVHLHSHLYAEMKEKRMSCKKSYLIILIFAQNRKNNIYFDTGKHVAIQCNRQIVTIVAYLFIDIKRYDDVDSVYIYYEQNQKEQ